NGCETLDRIVVQSPVDRGGGHERSRRAEKQRVAVRLRARDRLRADGAACPARTIFDDEGLPEHGRQPIRNGALKLLGFLRPQPLRPSSCPCFAEAPDRTSRVTARPGWPQRTGRRSRHDQLTNAARAALFGARRCTEGERKPRTCRAFHGVTIRRKPGDQGALDAPILFQGTNQARRGSRKRLSRPTRTAASPI